LGIIGRVEIRKKRQQPFGKRFGEKFVVHRTKLLTDDTCKGWVRNSDRHEMFIIRLEAVMALGGHDEVPLRETSTGPHTLGCIHHRTVIAREGFSLAAEKFPS